MLLPYAEYLKKIKGCYVGKCIGGTLGMPYEGEAGPLSLTYYNPVPTEMVPNDDLDLQVVLLERIRRTGLPVHRHGLADAWMDNIRQVFDEYGVALRNLRKGLYPPFSGAHNNKFTDGMGAIIRSELWACLCPGAPQLAAQLMREDACVDHCGAGVDAACFWAAVESAAFMESDCCTLLEIGLSCISAGRFSRCIRDTLRWWDMCHDVSAVRQRILTEYASQNFTDVSLNLPFIVLGWLAGGGEFGPSLCAAVNCGMDTDCTGASLGALLGLLDPEGIDRQWTDPIGDALVLSPNMIGTHEVETIDQLCMQIASVGLQVQLYYGTDVRVEGAPSLTEPWCRMVAPWKDTPEGVTLQKEYSQRESVIARTPVYTTLIHPEQEAIAPGQTAEYTLAFRGLKAGVEETYALSLSLPDGWAWNVKEQTVTVTGTHDTSVSVEITAPEHGKIAKSTRLDIVLENDRTRIEMSAGLAVAMVWKHRRDEDSWEEQVACGNSYWMVPAGQHTYTAAFKSGVRVEHAVLVTEGDRSLRVYLDDSLVAKADGTQYVPAVHRGLMHDRLHLTGTWQTIRVEVDDGPEGEIFLGIAKPYGLEWLEYIEWKID